MTIKITIKNEQPLDPEKPANKVANIQVYGATADGGSHLNETFDLGPQDNKELHIYEGMYLIVQEMEKA